MFGASAGFEPMVSALACVSTAVLYQLSYEGLYWHREQANLLSSNIIIVGY